MTQESRTQETPTADQGELTAAELAHVVGGEDTGPGSPGDHNGRSRM